MDEISRQKDIFSYENYVKNSKYLSRDVTNKNEEEPRRVNSVDSRGIGSTSRREVGGMRLKAEAQKPYFSNNFSSTELSKGLTEKLRLRGSQKIAGEKAFLTHQDSFSNGSDYDDRKNREKEQGSRVSVYGDSKPINIEAANDYENDARTRILYRNYEIDTIKELTRSMKKPLSLSELRSNNNKETLNQPTGQTEIKNSKAYISAMKALQVKIKQVENDTSSKIRELEDKVKSKELELEKLKLAQSEKTKLFEALEENLKTKLIMQEQENMEKSQMIAILSDEKAELEEQNKILTMKNKSEFEEKTRETGELRRILQQERDKGLFLEQNIENLRMELARLRKLKGEVDSKLISREDEMKKQQMTSAEFEKNLQEENKKLSLRLDDLKEENENIKSEFSKEKGLLEDELNILKVYCQNLIQNNNELERANQELENTLQEVDKKCYEYEERLEKLQKISNEDRAKSKLEIEKHKVHKKLSEAKYKVKEKELRQVREVFSSRKNSSEDFADSLNQNKPKGGNLLFLSPTASAQSDISMSNIEHLNDNQNVLPLNFDNVRVQKSYRKENLNPYKESKIHIRKPSLNDPGAFKKAALSNPSPNKINGKETLIDIYKEYSNEKERSKASKILNLDHGKKNDNKGRTQEERSEKVQLEKNQHEKNQYEQDLREILKSEVVYEKSDKNNSNSEYVELVKKAARLEFELQELKEKYRACSQAMIINSGLPSDITSAKNKLLDICERIEVVSEELFFIKNTQDRFINGNLNFAQS